MGAPSRARSGGPSRPTAAAPEAFGDPTASRAAGPLARADSHKESSAPPWASSRSARPRSRSATRSALDVHGRDSLRSMIMPPAPYPRPGADVSAPMGGGPWWCSDSAVRPGMATPNATLRLGAHDDREGGRMACGRPGARERLRSRIVSSDDQLALMRMRLHDSTLQTLEFIANSGAMAGADMELLVALAAREATELRHMLDGLTRAARVTLHTALGEAVMAAGAFGDEHIDLVVEHADDSIEPFPALELGAAVREALTNARKHAEATSIEVTVDERDGGACVTVADDGRGTDLATLAPRLGIGVSMRSRMTRLGGEGSVDSAPGQGFCV